MLFKLNKSSNTNYEIIVYENSHSIATLKFSVINNTVFKNWLIENCDLDTHSINDEYDDEKSENGIIILDEIIVSNQLRNNGVGKKLMEYFLKTCEASFNKIDTIFLVASYFETNNKNISSLINFYKQFDFKEVCKYSLDTGKIMKKYNI